MSAGIGFTPDEVRALLDMAVVQPEDDAGFLKRLERVWPELQRREMKRQAANPPRSWHLTGDPH